MRYRVIETNEEAFQNVRADFLDLATFAFNLIDGDFPGTLHGLQIVTERSDVGLESSGVAEALRPVDQEFQAEQRLSGPGTSGDQAGTPSRQPDTSNCVETLNSRGCFGKCV